MKSLKFYKTQVQDKILIAYFNNSSQRNCFGIDCAKELQQILKYIKKENLEGFLLTSKENVFCSGGNLSDYAKLKGKAPGIKINKEITKILKELNDISVPTICLVTGDCLGGGIEWISAFDQVYATPQALFGMWQRRIGLSWGWGGGHRLQNRISEKNLRNWLLNANNFSSYQALDIGLIDAIYTQEMILEKGMSFIKKQRDLPQIPFSKIKSSDFKNEQKLFEALWMNKEHQILLSKFR